VLSLTHLQERIEEEIRRLLPFQSSFTVTRAGDPLLDAWRGAAAWAASDSFSSQSFTRADYQEKGSDYLAEHGASNNHVRALTEADVSAAI
jgi:actin-related protein 5